MGYTASNDHRGAQIPRLINYSLHKRLTIRGVKVFANGTLGSRPAALITPYGDKPDTRGFCAPLPRQRNYIT